MNVNVVSGERHKVGGWDPAVLTRGVTSGASRMAARSHKETTYVWEPQQSSGGKRGQTSGTKREHALLPLTSALSTRIAAVD